MDPIQLAQLHRARTSLEAAARPNRAREYLKAVQCLAVSGNPANAKNRASHLYGHESKAASFLARGLISTESVADPDDEFTLAQHDFLALVAARSLIGKINAVRPLRRTQFYQPTLVQTARSKPSWVGEGQPILVAGGEFELQKLAPAKIGVLIPMTQEVAGGRFEDGFERDLTRGIAMLEGESFIDPDNAGSDEEPASITHGATTVPSSGITADDVRADIAALFEAYAGDLESAVITMHTETALKLGLMQSPLGQVNLTVNGGDLWGVPVVTSDSVPADSSGSSVAIMDTDQILFADEGVVIDASTNAAVNVTYDGQPGVWNAFEQNLVILRAIRRLSWKAVRPGSVAVLTNVAWGA
ncbi:phage major capsid protein [Vreelandella sp. H-I2]